MEQPKVPALWTSNESAPVLPDANALAALRIDRRVPRYKDAPPSARVAWLTKQITRIYIIKHIALVDANGRDRTQTIKMDAVALDGFMMRVDTIADLTQAEIQEAFTSGILGEYGDYVGVTSETLFKFLKAFCGSEKKQEATRLVREARERERAIAAENEKSRLRAEIEAAKKDGTFVPTWKMFTPKIVNAVTEEDQRAHREKIRLQAEMVRKGQI